MAASMQDVLATLSEKETELQNQLNGIRAAILALGGVVGASPVVAAPVAAPVEPVARLGRKPKEVVAEEEDTDESEARTKTGRKPKEIKLVAEFADAKSWNEKVVWALSKAEKLSADEIAHAIHKFEGGEFDKLKTMISSTASTLAKKGGISAVRNGRGFEYSLKG
jgi:hypothetical protein